MVKRSRSLSFGVDERPGGASIAVLALQHAALSVVFLVYAAAVAKSAGFTFAQQQAMVVGTLVSCGLGAIIQGGAPKFSSGLLVIPLSSPMFVIFAVPAGQEAGPAGIATLAVIGGLVQILVGQVLRQLRRFFPTEVCGVVVLMLGVSMVPRAIERIAGISGENVSTLSTASMMTGLATLGAIVACSVWLKGSARFFAMLIGCLVGYVFSWKLDLLGNLAEAEMEAPLLALPNPVLPDFSLEPSFMFAFAAVAMIAAIDSMGVLISTDRLDNLNQSKPDIAKVSRGVSSLGATTIVSGFLGGTHLGLSSSNISLSFATGVTARIVGVFAGVIMIGLSLFPKILVPITAMPEPILGGIFAFAASYFIIAGAQLSLTRMLSPRRLIVISLPIALGVGLQSLPELVGGVDGPMGVLLRSPLMVASMTAILLNAVMQIGITQRTSVDLLPGVDRHDQVVATLEEVGELWGLKSVTAMHASQVTNQLLEAVSELAEVPISLEATHDDISLNIAILYSGQPMIIPERAPTPEELLEDPDGIARMSGWLVKKLADHVKPFARGDQQGVMLRFEI